jgi:hypothetical protein
MRVVITQVIRGWAVEYDLPWWYAAKDGQEPLQAGTRAQLVRMIDRRES